MNLLQYETSPYLLQHKNNPVNWMAWNSQTLQKAKDDNKLILVSVGYAACHWCHVMEHECFEDQTVADIMNKYYISIKVDREERPDIDQIYMNAAQLTSGHGGWPLNVVCLPDGRPIYGATYFPKDRWIDFLMHFQNLFQNNLEKLTQQAIRITQGIKQIDTISFNEKEQIIDEIQYHQIWENWKDKLDYADGGTLGAPKFMMPNALEFLLRYQHRTKNEKTAAYLKTTLKKMAFGGLHDVVGGGFARYSVDTVWKVPHFEKMLYDNAQLLTVYAIAYQQTKRPMYKKVGVKILDWLNKEMTDKSGGIYSSLDADSEDIEGKFYCWAYDDFINVISKIQTNTLTHSEFIKFTLELYNITQEGNFEHGLNVLFRTKEHEYFCEQYRLEATDFHNLVDNIHQHLADARAYKIRPNLDDKILTEWNALTIIGCLNAYKSFGDIAFLNKAISILTFIQENIKQADYRLYRNYKNGKTSINGFLADYVFLIEALILLHQVTLDTNYLSEAKAFADYCLKHFYSNEHNMFYITSILDDALVVRSMDSSDNVISSANSQMAKNLLLLSKYFDDEHYKNIATGMLNNVLENILKHGQYYSNWAIVLDMFLFQNKELVIIGKDAKIKLDEIISTYLPDVLITGSIHKSDLPLLKDRFVENQTLFYLCEDNVCQLPSINLPDLKL